MEDIRIWMTAMELTPITNKTLTKIKKEWDNDQEIRNEHIDNLKGVCYELNRLKLVLNDERKNSFIFTNFFLEFEISKVANNKNLFFSVQHNDNSINCYISVFLPIYDTLKNISGFYIPIVYGRKKDKHVTPEGTSQLMNVNMLLDEYIKIYNSNILLLSSVTI